MKYSSTPCAWHRYLSHTKLYSTLHHHLHHTSPPPRCFKSSSYPRNFQRNLITSKRQQTISPTRQEPPYPLRIALVSSSTALCTPCFPAIGLVNLFLRTSIGRPLGNSLKWSNGIGCVVSFATWTLIPYNYQIAPLLLPFAIGNGLTAGSIYATVEGLSLLTLRKGTSLSVSSKGPWLAGGIGAMTGYVAPHYVYGEVYNQLYGITEIGDVCDWLMSVPFMTEVSISTGFVAGMALYPMLHFPMKGIPGVPYWNFSALVLALSTLGLYHVYTLPNNSEKHENTLPIPLPEGAYLPPNTLKYLDSIVRYNSETDEFQPYSPKVNDWLESLKEKQARDEACDKIRQYHAKYKGVGAGAVTFDHPIFAFLYRYIDHGIAERFQHHIISVPSPTQVLEHEEFMARTDLTIKFIAGRRNENRGFIPQEHQIEKIAEQYKHYSGAISKEERVRRVKNIQVVSIATDLYLLLKQKEREGTELSMEDYTLAQDLQRSINQKAPGVLLLQQDEKEGFRGQSVESQLQRLCLKRLDERQIRERWNEISRKKQRQIWKDGLLATTGLLLSLAGMVNSS